MVAAPSGQEGEKDRMVYLSFTRLVDIGLIRVILNVYNGHGG